MIINQMMYMQCDFRHKFAVSYPLIGCDKRGYCMALRCAHPLTSPPPPPHPPPILSHPDSLFTPFQPAMITMGPRTGMMKRTGVWVVGGGGHPDEDELEK